MALHVATVPKNTREEIRVSLAEYQGHDLLDLRVYFDSEDAGQWLPTKKGISVKLDRLDALIDALTTARKAAELAGQLPPVRCDVSAPVKPSDDMNLRGVENAG